MTDQPEEFFITKGGAYYRPKAEGYTTCRGEAGRFSLEDAIKYSHPNGPDGPRDGIRYEKAPPKHQADDDLPPELLERSREAAGMVPMWDYDLVGETLTRDELNNIIRAVAPILIAHGRELEKAEVVAWLEQRERDSMNGHVVAGCRIGIKNGEHKQESQ